MFDISVRKGKSNGRQQYAERLTTFNASYFLLNCKIPSLITNIPIPDIYIYYVRSQQSFEFDGKYSL